MKMSRRAALSTLSLSAICSPLIAFAQDWPQKDVNLIVPYLAGGRVDPIARMIGQKLTEK